MGMSVLPMCASPAMLLAQEPNLDVLRRADLPCERRIKYGQPLLASGAFFAVAIDDLILGAPPSFGQASAKLRPVRKFMRKRIHN